MMCRQVLPDSNGIEQIYIVKSEPGVDGDNGPVPMAPEDVDQIKQEPSSDGDDETEPEVSRTEETSIKDETIDKSGDGSNYSDYRGTDEETSEESNFESGPSKRKSLKRKFNQYLDYAETSKRMSYKQYASPGLPQGLSEEQCTCHCGMIYRKESLLIKHKQICDIPEELMEGTCRFCQQTFTPYSDLLKHVKHLHGLGMPEIECIFCTERFKNATLLVIHELRHQLPNVIKCDQCNRIFRQQSNLDRHLKLHSDDVETFACEDCGKTFTQSTNLEIHKRIHSGMRPGSCDLCSKSFYCPSTLRLHRLTHFKAKSFHVSRDSANKGDVSNMTNFTGKSELQDGTWYKC